MYGELRTVKIAGEGTWFQIVDKEGNPLIDITPREFARWLERRTGHLVSFFVSDTHFQIVDETIKKEKRL